MKNIKKYALLICVFAMVLFANAAFADVIDLIRQRSTTCWVEGQIIDDMVLGARAKLVFIYVDGELSRALTREDAPIPEWLRYQASGFGSSNARGKSVFIVSYETLKPMNFDPTEVTIGGYKITMKDLLNNTSVMPLGDIPTGTHGAFSVAVPIKAEKGVPVEIAYGESVTSFTVGGKKN